MFFAVILCLASCMKSTFSSSYNLLVTFEYTGESVYLKDFSRDSIAVIQEDAIGFTWVDPTLVFGQRSSNGQFYGGFVMSYLKGEADGQLTREPSTNDRFRVYAPSGYDGSKTYVVFCDNPNASMMPSEQMTFYYKTLGTCEMSGCYVNNTTLVARKIKEHFQEGDKLVLRAKGYLNEAPTGEASIVLAEYTPAKDSIMYTWTPFNLGALGSIDEVVFKIESTNASIPQYVCLDDIVAACVVEY